MSPEAAVVAAQLTADLCLQRLRAAGKPWVFAERLPTFDRAAFIDRLAAANGSVRLAILGGPPSPETPDAPGRVETTTSSTKANEWRHDAEALRGRKAHHPRGRVSVQGHFLA